MFLAFAIYDYAHLVLGWIFLGGHLTILYCMECNVCYSNGSVGTRYNFIVNFHIVRLNFRLLLALATVEMIWRGIEINEFFSFG